MTNAPPCERSAYVDGLGTVRVTTAQCSSCGRPVAPSDFQNLGDGLLRAVCAGCHCDVVQIELDEPDPEIDEAA
jgi:hypothetical protein